MTSFVRILTTLSFDSFPSILLISPTGYKTLINCGEGCQRSFLESKNRIRRVNRICLTRIGYEEVGGLPGMILTGADVAEIAKENQLTPYGPQKNRGGNKHRRTTTGQPEEGKEGDLEVIGPEGTSAFLHSLRHFMRRDRFQVSIHEGEYRSSVPANLFDDVRGQGKRKKKYKKKDNVMKDGFIVQSIPLSHKPPPPTKHADKKQKMDNNSSQTSSISISSYLFTTPKIPGKFLPTKAKELGIPPGKLYGILKSGQSVTFRTGNGEEKTVHSNQVVTEPCPGVGVAIIHCPSLDVLNQLKEVKSLESFVKGENDIEMDCMIHLTPHQISEHEEYSEWMKSFGEDVQHILLNSGVEVGCGEINDWKEGGGDTPFIAASLGAMTRNLVCKDIYPKPFVPMRAESQNDEMDKNGKGDDRDRSKQTENVTSTTKIDSSDAEKKEQEEMGNLNNENKQSSETIQQTCTKEESDNEQKDSPTDTNEQKDSSMDTNERNDDDAKDETIQHDADNPPQQRPTIIHAQPMMEFHLIPRSKKGLDLSNVRTGISSQKLQRFSAKEKVQNAISLAKKIISSHNSNNSKPPPKLNKPKTPPAKSKINNFSSPPKVNHISSPPKIKASSSSGTHKQTSPNPNPLGELTFTGTGAALPCKFRNVSGIYLRMNNGNAILLDIGEGTTGQLLRIWSSSKNQPAKEILNRLKGTKAAWVSHPHADHHLGLLRFLTYRNTLFPDDPIILMAPPNLFAFLEEYAAIDQRVKGSYIPLGCRQMILGKGNNPLSQKLRQVLNITSCLCVQVTHCPYSYALLLANTSFGNMAYSGDCRPSEHLVQVGRNATDLLIHEATFENGMEEEAVLKRHSTVGEALDVGRRMKAKNVILTHFSQRYPRIPPATECEGMNNKFRRYLMDGELRSNGRQDKGSVSSLEGNREGRGRGRGGGGRGRGRGGGRGGREKEEGGGVVVVRVKEEDGEGGGREKGEGVEDDDMPIVFAFDFMTLKPENLKLAAKITPALRVLYPDVSEWTEDGEEEDDDDDEKESNESVTAKDVLSVPGAFAVKEFL